MDDALNDNEVVRGLRASARTHVVDRVLPMGGALFLRLVKMDVSDFLRYFGERISEDFTSALRLCADFVPFQRLIEYVDETMRPCILQFSTSKGDRVSVVLTDNAIACSACLVCMHCYARDKMRVCDVCCNYRVCERCLKHVGGTMPLHGCDNASDDVRAFLEDVHFHSLRCLECPAIVDLRKLTEKERLEGTICCWACRLN